MGYTMFMSMWSRIKNLLLNAEWPALDAERSALDAEWPALDAEWSALDAERSALDIGLHYYKKELS